MRISSLVGALVVLFGLANTAQANDRWAGFYTGIHVGHASGDFSNDDRGATPPHWWGVSLYGSDTDSLFGGVQAGYNLTFTNFLIGVEGEFGSGLLGGTATDTGTGNGKDSDPVTKIDSDYYASVTARAGVLIGSALFYAKGGWGTVDAEIDWSDTTYTSFAGKDKSLDGAVYGGGVELAVAPGMSVKIEYLHFDIGDNTTLDTQGTFTGYQQFIKIDDVDTVKIGVNVKLGGWSAE